MIIPILTFSLPFVSLNKAQIRELDYILTGPLRQVHALRNSAHKVTMQIAHNMLPVDIIQYKTMCASVFKWVHKPPSYMNTTLHSAVQRWQTQPSLNSGEPLDVVQPDSKSLLQRLQHACRVLNFDPLHQSPDMVRELAQQLTWQRWQACDKAQFYKQYKYQPGINLCWQYTSKPYHIAIREQFLHQRVPLYSCLSRIGQLSDDLNGSTECLLCDEDAPYAEESIHHVLLQCTKYTAPRTTMIDMLRSHGRRHHHTATAAVRRHRTAGTHQTTQIHHMQHNGYIHCTSTRFDIMHSAPPHTSYNTISTTQHCQPPPLNCTVTMHP